MERASGHKQPFELSLSGPGWEALAEVAGAGEVLRAAAAAVDDVRAALETEGWVLLQELHTPTCVVRHALIGRGGVVVAIPCGPVPRHVHFLEAEQQAAELAAMLALQRSDVTAALVLFESNDPPHPQFLGGSAAYLVGDYQMHSWLSHLPEIVSAERLDQLRTDISAHAAKASARQPARLPTTPKYG